MIRAFLLLGSNLGERKNFLDNARVRIHLLAGTVVKSSSRYETAAWGNTDQAAFQNQAVAIDTLLSPDLLLFTLQAIEDSLGRKRDEQWGPRTIDIDILLFGDQVINQPNLIIPHPAMPERKFALMPLAELIPDGVHPITGKTIAAMLSECTDPLSVEKLGAGR